MSTPSLPPSQTKLLFRKGFFAFFVTQLLSALNDNFLKNAVVIWSSATRASMFGLSPDVMISLCSGAFILPFFLFSASAGTILPSYAQNTLGAHAHVVTLFLSVFCVGIALGSLLTEKVSGKNLELGLVPLGSIGPDRTGARGQGAHEGGVPAHLGGAA